MEAFRDNLRELLQKFPRGQLADDALNQLATDYLFEQDLENAELYYGKLRELEGDNDFKDSAYYLPAMGFIGRGPGGKWKLIEPSGPSSITDYLLDPSHNMKLWARWARDDLKIPRQGETDIGLMEHQAGIGNVKRWRLYWNAVGAPGDLEYRIETARFPATRAFARSVLADLAIVDSAGLFADAELKP